jgi:xanthine phosphoribosyltransferase
VELLKEKIRLEGKVLSDMVLKVDSFINHQVDPVLVMEIGKAFAKAFEDEHITKVLTIESSGIQFAMGTALALGVPFVYAKKKKAITQSSDLYSASVESFTRNETYQITLSKQFLTPNDRVLIVDDFLATGAALVGLIGMIRESGAALAGAGIVIEKSFQEGRKLIEDAGVRICSLARIASMSPGEIHFIEELKTSSVK